MAATQAPQMRAGQAAAVSQMNLMNQIAIINSQQVCIIIQLLLTFHIYYRDSLLKRESQRRDHQVRTVPQLMVKLLKKKIQDSKLSLKKLQNQHQSQYKKQLQHSKLQLLPLYSMRCPQIFSQPSQSETSKKLTQFQITSPQPPRILLKEDTLKYFS